MKKLVLSMAIMLFAVYFSSLAIASNVRGVQSLPNSLMAEWRCPKCGGDHKVVVMQTAEHIWLADGTIMTIPPPAPKIVVVEQCPPRATFAAKPPVNHPQALGWPQPRWLLERPRLLDEKPLPAPVLLPK